MDKKIILINGLSNVKSKIKNALRYYKSSLWISIAAIIAVIFATGCTPNQISKQAEYPELNIMVDNIGNIIYICNPNPMDEYDNDRPIKISRWNEEDNYIFQLYASEYSIENAPYVAIGSKIEINFTGNPPDSIKLYDQLLTEEGLIKYDHRLKENVTLEYSGGKYSFELDGSFASFLSSNSKDYMPGNTIRGFNILCNWDDKKYEYSFVLRTDAVFPSIKQNSDNSDIK